MERHQDRDLQLMQLIKSSPAPLGATFLGKEMGIPAATVGRMLARLEKEKKLKKIANRGRELTPEGRKYVSSRLKRSDKLNTASKLIRMIEENSRERLLEVLQVRRLLETKTVELAALRATEEDIATLEGIIFDYTYEVKHGISNSESDMKLHLAIAKISGNATISHVLKLFLLDDNTYTLITAAAAQSYEERLRQHLNIVEGIKSKSAAKATAAMAEHLDDLIDSIR